MNDHVFKSNPEGREPEVITPHRGGYVRAPLIIWSSVIGLIALVMICGLGYLRLTGDLRLNEMSLILCVAFVAVSVILGYQYLRHHISHRKARYTIYADRVTSETGGLFSDQENELIYKNVTHVSLILPYIEHKLYKTGHIRIESAGALGAEIKIWSVEQPEELYQRILEALRYNGFSLERSELIQSERPHSLAVLLATARAIFYAALLIMYGLLMDERQLFWTWMMDHPQALGGVGVLVSVIVAVYSRFVYLDVSRRAYHLFDDSVEYHEGFLTKVSTVIPLENLSDSSINQGVIGQIFGFYDVKLSCQGSSQEISFSNITNGDELSLNLDHQLKLIRERLSERLGERLSNRASTRVQGVSSLRDDSAQVSSIQEGVSRDLSALHSTDDAPRYDQTSTLELQIDKLKVMFPIGALALLAIVFIIGGSSLGFSGVLYGVHIPMVIGAFVIAVPSLLIKMLCNTYQVKPLSVERTFSFLGRVTTEFSFDKVTAITFKRSLIDRVLNTCSVHFWSIGSGQPLVLADVRIDEETRHILMRKCGVEPSDESRRELGASHSVISMIAAHLWSCLLFVVIVAGISYQLFWVDQGVVISDQLIYTVYGSIITLVILGYLLSSLSQRTFKLSLYQHHVGFRYGLITQYERYALYSDIKDVEVVSYPLMNQGELQLNIAGELDVSQPKNQRVNIGTNTRFNVYSFKLHHLQDAKAHGVLIDELLLKSNAPTAEVINALVSDPPRYDEHIKARPSLKNSLFVTTLSFAVLTVFAAVFVPVFSTSLMPYEDTSTTTYPLLGAAYAISALLIVISLRCKTYSVQDRRVVARSGVIYKREISILFNRIDSISVQQGFLHKLCGNGNITVNTTGSSAPEITIENISNHQALYRVLKDAYQA